VSIAAVALIAAFAFALGRLTGDHVQSTPSSAPSESPTSTSLNVTDAALSLMGITVERADTGNLSAEVSAPGTVSAAVNSEAVVTAHASGRVSRITKRLGESVKAGETLAFVTSRDAAGLAAERRAAESKATLARSVVERERELFEQRVTPRQDLEAAEA